MTFRPRWPTWESAHRTSATRSRIIAGPFPPAGISDDTWAQVFYHSLFRLTQAAVFADGRAAVLSSAAAQGFSMAELDAIRAAFDDVGIDAPVMSVVLAA